MQKNVVGQSVTLFAFDYSNNQPKVGDASNLTGYVSIDDGPYVQLTTLHPTEDDAVHAKGAYTWPLTQAETNGNKLKFSGVSTTANVEVTPETFYTTLAVTGVISEDDTTITVS